MEDEVNGSRFWCHLCEQIVNPIMEQHQLEIKCPFCQSGFVEEMMHNPTNPTITNPNPDLGSDRALSLWAPILLGMMGNPRRRRRLRHIEFDEDDDNDTNEDDDESPDLESIIRRRRRSSATILQFLQGIRAGLASESPGDRDESVILINPFNQTVVVQGQNGNQNPTGSLGDYFIGPGLDLLLQHLAENDPNRYGTPPARKEAVEALPTVAVKESLQCSVCLDDFDPGSEAKEMPCNHKFHEGCILPWLDLHSSCPVCRFQLPADESKPDPLDEPRPNGIDDHDESDDPSGRRFSFPWPFSGLFAQSNEGNASGSNTSNSGTGGNASSN